MSAELAPKTPSPDLAAPFQKSPVSISTFYVCITQAMYATTRNFISVRNIEASLKPFVAEKGNSIPCEKKKHRGRQINIYGEEGQKVFFAELAHLNRRGKVFKEKDKERALDTYCRMCGF